MRLKPMAIGLFAAVAGAGWTCAAQAAESGFMVVAGGDMDRDDSSVVMLDLSSVQHTGDVVTARMAMVVVQPDRGRVPGLSYMLGREQLSCSARTTRTLHVEVYGLGGTRLTEFDGEGAPQPVNANTAWASILDRACQDQAQLQDGAAAYATVDEGVAAVRASVEAAQAVQSAMSPHRFVPLSTLSPQPGRSVTTFIDRAQLEHDGPAVVRWMLLAHTPQRSEAQHEIAYDLVQLSFDCAARRWRFRLGLSFNEQRQLVRSSIELGPWSTLDPRRADEVRQMQAACEPAPEGETSFADVAEALAYAQQRSGRQAEAEPGRTPG
jgi:hypothetical protein